MVSGAITAIGSAGGHHWQWWMLGNIVLGAFFAALLNTASNILNQITDLEADRINKPNRPIPSGKVTVGEAWVLSLASYALALVVAWIVTRPGTYYMCFICALIAAVATYIYSAPPIRTKRFGWWANLTIATPRGLFLKVAGWSLIIAPDTPEAWYIGSIFFLFLLGASSTKDFADMKGDEAAGCRTLPIVYGVKRTAWMIAPSFVVPFLLMPVGAHAHVLTGNLIALDVLGVGLAAWGCYVVWLMVRRPEELATVENHVSWTHMYLMMFTMQVGFAAAYLV
jgi:4-hydroxybenzoate polyprenyltransferase